MKKLLFAIAMLSVLALGSCKKEQGVKFTFDGSKEMSGAKFALKDINPDLPEDWDGYNFVVLEYKIGSAQRFQLGFTTDWGYNELRVMCYVPNAWNRIAIPLKYYTELPAAAVDLAATFNHARYTGWVNLGGERGPMHGVDSVGVRMRRAIGNPTIQIRNIELAVEDPGDLYMEDTPAVDEFGQSMLADYPEKVHSLEELEAQWRAEEEGDFSSEPYNYSKYGGYKQKQVKGTGFFRTEKIDGRWWFVDPEGYLFLSVGVDGINIGYGGNLRAYEKRSNMYREIAPDSVAEELGMKQPVPYGIWNQYRRFGKDYLEPALDLTVKRMDKWGVNTIANWSSGEVTGLHRKAYTAQMRGLALDGKLMGLCDVYAPDYKERLDRAMQSSVRGNEDNPWIIGYFIGNEPAWIGEEPRLCQIILDGEDRPLKSELQKYLAANGDTDVTRRAFIINCFDIFLKDVQRTFKKYDPNHLNIGIRFGNPDSVEEDLLKICAESIDVFSFNCYQLKPEKSTLDRAMAIMDRPMIIGEYHFGTVDRGYAQSLWQVTSQEQRGVAYRYYTEQGYSHPALVGTAYFRWQDQDLTGRNDGENYNCGLIDITDRPYKEQVEAMMETAKVLYEVHSGTREPFSQEPEFARGHGSVPDLWNE